MYKVLDMLDCCYDFGNFVLKTAEHIVLSNFLAQDRKVLISASNVEGVS